MVIRSLLVVAVVLCNCQENDRSQTLFTALTSEETGIVFRNENREDENANILTYEYFYNGGGVAIGDINNDSLPDIYLTSNQGENRLYLNRGNLRFQDITASAGVRAASGWKTGVAMADVNADGFLDIYVCRSGNLHPLLRQNSLYINNGNLTFTDRAAEFGLNDDSFSTQASFLDYDNDGDLDMFLLNHSSLEISNSFDIRDRYRRERTKYVGNKLYNNRSGKFFDVSDSSGIFGPASNYGLGVAASDLNHDGWIDIYATNDYTQKDQVLLNKNGKFVEVSDSLLTHMSQFSMGVDIADVNNDAWEDIVTVDMLPADNHGQKEFFWPDRYDTYRSMVENGLHHQFMRNMLHINNGDGTFSEVGQLAGISNTDWSWGPLFADFDNDAWADLFISNGFKRNFTSNDFLRYKADLALKAKREGDKAKLHDLLARIPPNPSRNFLFRNAKGSGFQDLSVASGFDAEDLTNGAAFGDLDNDGDLDLVTNRLDNFATVYRNNVDGKNYLKVKLIGANGNTFGIGATVSLFTNAGILTRTQMPQRGFQSSVEPLLHFGVGDISSVDSAVIQWPGGRVQTLKNIRVAQTLIVEEASAKKKPRAGVSPMSRYFREVKPRPSFVHRENHFNDFNVQSLLPRMYSTEGPALAVADVNNDGLDDLFAGGAKGQPSSLLLQRRNRVFKMEGVNVFAADSLSEDVDAVFFDKDSDGDKDLYVVTGGYKFARDAVQLHDRLYENDGKGTFKKVALPESKSSGSCVRPADIDNDGDIDLFVGARIVPGAYPEMPESHVLVNDGAGAFTISHDIISGKPGMVTDARWANLNADGLPDLIVCGEWMSLQIYINEQGKLTDRTREYIKTETSGWWLSLAVSDFDKDGDDDVLAGNFGTNNQFRPDAQTPLTVYYDDYDNNGSVDPIITYNIGGSYPMATRDELTTQVPMFKKRFPDYQSYAKADINAILTDEERKQSNVLRAVELRSLFLENKGGGFAIHSLPAEFNFAPVFAIAVLDLNEDDLSDVVAAGNLTGMRARLGKASGNFGSVFLGQGNGAFSFIPNRHTRLSLRGDIRKIIVSQNLLFIAVNGGGISVFQID
ncbi:MAG TPA: VCBS repeat-containing protein [Chryseosolibacter sp.]|nr:VCBS repeat-containing protein [Chryseosolibacter sp.]